MNLSSDDGPQPSTAPTPAQSAAATPAFTVDIAAHRAPCPCPLCTDDPAVEAITVRYPAPIARNKR